MTFPRVPDEVIEEIRQMAEAGEGVQWAMGDFLVDVVDELAPQFANQADSLMLIPTKQARTEIVRQIADATGLDRSTVRDRENMARFFTPVMREEYAPLTYYQLRACRAAKSRWKDYADWALVNLPAPCAVIRGKIKDDNRAGQPGWVTHWEYMVKKAIILVEWPIDAISKPPPAVVNACVDLLRKAALIPGLEPGEVLPYEVPVGAGVASSVSTPASAGASEADWFPS